MIAQKNSLHLSDIIFLRDSCSWMIFIILTSMVIIKLVMKMMSKMDIRVFQK